MSRGLGDVYKRQVLGVFGLFWRDSAKILEAKKHGLRMKYLVVMLTGD